ncbi:MAG TPA: YDG domain-containing protein [Nocardioides sp.]|nr:YDG domain-containing protein [Nocardioides sp.]
MSLHAPARRTRRLVSAIAATALGVGALAAGTSAAHAGGGNSGDNAVTATVTPTSVVGGSTTEFDLRVAAGNMTGNVGSLIKVAVPAGFDNVNVVPGTFTYSSAHTWGQTFESPNTVVFTETNASGGLVGSEWVDVHVTAHAVGGGAQTWTTSAWKGTASSSNALPVLASPVVTISGGSQTLTFGALGNKTWGDADFTVAATSTSSANPITYTASGDCTIVSGNQVHLVQAGSCTVTAHQAAGNGYTAAADVSQGFTINKASQTITFGALADKTWGAADFSVSATASSGLAVTFTGDGQCSVSGTTVHLTGAGACTITAHQAGNVDFSAAADVPHAFAINKAGATINVSDLEQTYDGAGHAITTTTSPSGLQVDVAYSQGGSPVAHPTAAGTYDFTATVDDANYSGSTTGQLVIDRRVVHGTFAAADKAYDGTTAADVTSESLTDAVAGDDVHLTGGTAAFDGKDAGTQGVTLTGAALTGSAQDNYTLSSDAITTTATINPRLVTAVLSASDKEYDGTNGVVSGEVTVDLTAGDVLSPDTVGVAITSASFDGTDVGAHTVTATVHLTDNALGDYTLGAGTSVSDAAGIYQRLTTGSFTADDKVYDATTVATVHSTNLTRVVNGDDVSLVVDPAVFADKTVGSGKTVTGTFSLAGGRAGQYVLADVTGTTQASITAASVSASITADNKVYDAGTGATIHPTVTGVIGGDTVTATGSGSFADKNVGTGKTVTSTDLALGGADGGNYTLAAGPWTTTANITAKSVTGSITADNKVYDATTGAAIHPSVTGVLGGDTVTVTGSGSFADKNVGTGKTVTSTDLTLGGTDGGNYTLAAGPWTTTANITAKSVTASITADNKVWDGTTTATIHPSLTGVIAGDSVSVGGTGTFASSNVGTWTVTSTDLTLGGTDGGNYHLAAGPWTTTAKITPAYVGTGFYQPVDMNGVLNKIKGGQTVPLKFNEKDANGVNQTTLSIFAANAFSVTSMACSTTAPTDPVELVTTGNTSLRYDATGGQYIQNWKTPTTVGCYAVKVTTVDGSTIGPAYFQITK